MSATPKYTAFISYSRRDEEAVKKLYRRLTDYRIPGLLQAAHGKQLGRFFLDREELGAAGELDEELFEKLDETRRLIVCCSPSAAASKWVNAEAKAFVEKHGRSKLLAVVLDGEPQDAFPPILKEDEPLAADFRPQGDGEEHGFLKLVAGLLYVDLGELRDQQAIAEKRRARTRNALVVLFAVLTVVASVAAVFAVRASHRAQAMTKEAIAIGAGVVEKTDTLSRQFGVPTSAVEALLTFADERFTKLFGEGVRSEELIRQQMTLLVDFSRLYGRLGDSAAQAQTAERAVKILQNDLPTNGVRSIDFVEAYATLGDARAALGQTDAAKTAYQGAIDAARRMLQDFPSSTLARNRLAASLQRQGRLLMAQREAQDALPLFREAHLLLTEITDMTPGDGLAIANALIALNWVGSAESLDGDRASAERTFSESITRAQRFLETTPDSLPALSALGSAHMKLGQTLSDAGEDDRARAHLLDSIQAARRLADRDEDDAQQQRDLALRWVLLANLDVKKNALKKAVEHLREASRAYEPLVTLDPLNVEQKISYAQALALEAETLTKLKDPANALARRTRAAQLWSTIVSADRETRIDRLKQLATAHELQGDAAATARDLD
ncbi:MAG: TIR domain-containing protein, partial [Myxococcota bacterium]